MAKPERHLKALGDFSTEGLCRRILERHRDKIRTKKPHVAVENLTRVIEAVLRLSNRQGFHATSLRDLARESGLSMGGLYSYFDSKDTLLLMILGEVDTTVMEVLHSAPAEVAAAPQAHLAWLIEIHTLLTEAMQPWFLFAYMEAKSFPPSARRSAIESEAASEQVFAEVLKRGVAAGVFSTENPDVVAGLIKPLLQDWYVKRGKWRKRGLDASAYAAEVVSFVRAAVAVRGTATQKPE